MRFENNPKPFVQLVKALHTNGFSHQARHAIAPFVVQAFNYAGLAAAFVAGPVLPRRKGRKESGIRFVKVGINQLTTIFGRHPEPHLLQCFLASVAHAPGQNLMCQDVSSAKRPAKGNEGNGSDA